ncbi:MAG: RluA family pseudouridine synthase [Candidatus Omnitrophica bacterium]|nr:RluA family pseudouridine synthase [Candidatus Omnitrophota bacterium]
MNANNKILNLKIGESDTIGRLDKCLADKLSKELSRSDIKRLIDQGNVSLNDLIVKPNHKIKLGDRITLILEEKAALEGLVEANIPLDIIFEDKYIIVVNKPAGLVVHPAAGHFSDTLVNALIFYCKNLSDLNGPMKLGIVHRLDKDTSGLLIIAKDNKTHRHLANQFKKHTIEKTYVAIVQGSVNYDEGIIDAPLSRNLFNRKKMSVSHASSRQAITRYKVLKRFANLTLLEVYPQTGRTHQIRVHMAHLGYPILGDSTYNKSKGIKGLISRQALHAEKIRFKHPHTAKMVEFKAKIPNDMQSVIKSMS